MKRLNGVNKVKKVKKYFVTFVTICTLVTICTFVTFVAYAGIQNTKHDLSPSSPRGATIYSPAQTIYAAPGGTTEKCVFCHTPHASSGSYPLWNRALSGAWYTVAQQQTAPWLTLLSPGKGIGEFIGQPDGSSKLCLGCHDGTVAIGAVKNTPGRGSTGAISMVGVTAEGYMPPTAYGYVGTNFVAAGFIKHPFSLAVTDQLINDKLTQCTDPVYPVEWMLQYPPSGDPVALRPTTNTYKGASGNGVQCRSCHDPHDDTRGDFLVKGNPTPGDNSPLCETCHIPCPL